MSGAEEFAAEFGVSRETIERLEIYAALVRKWTRKINLVADSTVDDLWSRHIRDSAQLHQLLPGGAARVLDIGSGAGFPGAVLAILAKDSPTPPDFSLIEADMRKATFLRTVSRETGVGFKVIADRIEAVERQGADVLTARALAPLPTLLEHLERHGGPGAVGLFPKGENVDAEIAKALETWTFDCEKIASLTHDRASVLRIGDLQRA